MEKGTWCKGGGGGEGGGPMNTHTVTACCACSRPTSYSWICRSSYRK